MEYKTKKWISKCKQDSQWGKQEACFACRRGSLSNTTPVSLLANKFGVPSIFNGQVSLAAVNQICFSYGHERLQKVKDSLKVCFDR